MPSFNKIQIVGHLGKDPVLRYTPQGDAVCEFSMATSEKGKNGESSTWFKVVVWGKRAETINQYLSKGKPAFVDGRLKLEEYKDNNGATRSSLVVTANDVQFLGSAPEGKARVASASTGNDTGTLAEKEDPEELPF